MTYPLMVPCTGRNGRKCRGLACLHQDPSIPALSERGPWYRCRVCGLMAPLLDFVPKFKITVTKTRSRPTQTKTTKRTVAQKQRDFWDALFKS